MQRFVVASALALAAVEAGEVCYKDFYSLANKGRGIHSCPGGLEKDGLLCYPKCRKGYYGVGPVCWSHCPSGWRDDGALCNNRGGWTKGSKRSGCPWYDACGLWNDCTSCPSGTQNHGCTCHKPLEVRAKKSYGRGAGKALQCASNEVQKGLFCYPKCHDRADKKYELVGDGCWEKCSGATTFECGVGCTSDGDTCARWTAEMAGTAAGVLLGAVVTIASGGSAGLVLAGLGSSVGYAAAGHGFFVQAMCGATSMELYSDGKCEQRPFKTRSGSTIVTCNNACLAHGHCKFASFDVDTNACFMYKLCKIDDDSKDAWRYTTYGRVE